VNLLHSAITEDGAQGFAFILPSPRRYSESALYQTTLVQHQTLASGFEEAGFSAFDLFPEYLVRFGQHPYRSLWALPNDGHPGEELHSYYADAIWDAIAPILERMPMSDVPIPSPCDTLP
jgi:hypothetical protein